MNVKRTIVAGVLSAAFLVASAGAVVAQVPPDGTKHAPAKARPNATAPRGGRWTDRATVRVNAIYQGATNGFNETFTFDQYGEQARVSTAYPKTDAAAFDVGGGIRLWRNLAVTASVSYLTRSGTATVTGAVPHPLYVSQDRGISGSLGTRRTEMAVHAQAAWVIPAGKKVLVTIGAGPSIFSVRQLLVSGVRWSDAYPFDTAQFSGAESQEATKTVVGFNAGADLAYFFSRTVGVGGFARYAGAAAQLGGRSGSLVVDAGGIQGGVGLRVRIPAGGGRAAAEPAPRRR